MTDVKTQNQVIDLITQLRQNVYGECKDIFYDNFFRILSSKIPIIKSTIDESFPYNAIIILDTNQCTTIPNFVHNKEFYMPIVYEALFQTFSYFNQYMGNKNIVQAQHTINTVFKSCNDYGVCPYKLFDLTAILDNEIIIYF